MPDVNILVLVGDNSEFEACVRRVVDILETHVIERLRVER